MTVQVIVTLEDVRLAKERHGGYCTRGVAAWLERYGMSLRHLARAGYPVEMIEAPGDSFGNTVAQIARDRAKVV